jgi:hypothetical protein
LHVRENLIANTTISKKIQPHPFSIKSITPKVDYDGKSTILAKCGFLALNRKWALAVRVCTPGGG